MIKNLAPSTSPELIQASDVPVRALAEIVAHFEPSLNGQGKMKFYEALAAKLSAAVRQDPPWTAKYIQSAISGTVLRGPLRRAILALAASLDDVPIAFARAEAVEVYAEPGTVKPGAYVFGQSVACAHPPCRSVFIKDNPRRIYCPRCDSPQKRKASDVPVRVSFLIPPR